MDHIERQIPPEAHTSMYNFHKYWSRKTWNVVGEFIKNYTSENDIIFDPFGGSGVTAIEALKYKRKVIICDLAPSATEITRLTIKHIDLLKIDEAFNKIEKKISERINNLYLTECKKCKKKIPFICSIWEKNLYKEIRYKCPLCKETVTSQKPANDDLKILKDIDNTEIKDWYPRDKFEYDDNNNFKEVSFAKKEKYESIDQLFTKRNLLALSILYSEIEKIKDNELKNFFKIAFTSMVHLCTKMMPDRPSRLFSGGWTQHSYWYAEKFMEQNVWEKFESSIIGKQGLLKAKQESNKYFKKIKFAKNFKEIFNNKADVYVHQGDCIELMDDMKSAGFMNKIDYIFTDPPYDQSIQFGELNFLWVAWLKKGKNYLNNITSYEIVNNKSQGKNFEVYNSLLNNCFKNMNDLLKPNKYLTLTFHNPSFKIRNAIISTGMFNGFKLEKIHHQELARPSAKSLLQPFGSAQGDFYLRFRKQIVKPEMADGKHEIRFKNIIIKTVEKIIAERGEPTPYTILINAIDPELAKRGYYSQLDSGLTMEDVLKKQLDENFILVDAKIGELEGKLWWFKDPKTVRQLYKIPLGDRVEQTILRKLQSMGRVSFTDVWESVSLEFPNSLSTDQESIINVLKDFAKKTPNGQWIIKENFNKINIDNEHTTIIALLAEIGLKKKYQVHIGKVEQSHKITSLESKYAGNKLKQLVNFDKINSLINIINPDIVDDIDILWIKDNKVKFAFEIECSTSMTSGLQRCSNVYKSKKIMIFPQSRLRQFDSKMRSPLFSEKFKDENWSFVIIDYFLKKWGKEKLNLDIEKLYNKRGKKNFTGEEKRQFKLF